LFGAFADDTGNPPGDEATEVAYKRLALLYHGDCLFALNEPATLEEALVTYRRAAARYQGEPAALTAQVQIANVYLRQGKLTEAARAVERARWLLRNIPDAAFAECGDGLDRASWDRFLEVVRSSSLFQNVLAGAQ
jgi:tetratricopeptide (TPR) repeat protein